MLHSALPILLSSRIRLAINFTIKTLFFDRVRYALPVYLSIR
nr:MAG TPA: hypothetical protein [Caudoviricetes sp.]